MKDKRAGLTEFIVLFLPCKNMRGEGWLKRIESLRFSFGSCYSKAVRRSTCRHANLPRLISNSLLRERALQGPPLTETRIRCSQMKDKHFWNVLYTSLTFLFIYFAPDNLVYTGLQDVRPRNRSSISGRGIFLFSTASWHVPVPTLPHIQWVTGDSLLGGKATGAWS
jgi:hypothetical protein